METKTKEVCDICLGKMVVGQGLFTAECSHLFHSSCIASRVEHGCHFCPTCRATWTHTHLFIDDKPLPAPAPAPAPNTNTSTHPHNANMIVEKSSSSAVLNDIQALCLSPEVSDRQIVPASPDFTALLEEIQIKADEIMEQCRRNRENARS